MNAVWAHLLAIAFFVLTSLGQDLSLVWNHPQGPYLGQKPPGTVPVIFASGIVSTDVYNHSSVTFSPDGQEIYWAMGPLDHPRRIYVSRWLSGGWSRPEVVSFTEEFDGDCPVLSPDGQKLYFNSSRPLSPGGTERERYWLTERVQGGWSEPRPLGPHINGAHLHWQASVDSKGNFYFGSAREGSKGRDDIFVASGAGGENLLVANLGAPINTGLLEGCPYVAPDSSYLIFDREGLWISYKAADGTWDEPISLELEGTCPYVSPDGKYLFFLKMGMGYNDIYWVDASVLPRPQPPDTNR